MAGGRCGGGGWSPAFLPGCRRLGMRGRAGEARPLPRGRSGRGRASGGWSSARPVRRTRRGHLRRRRDACAGCTASASPPPPPTPYHLIPGQGRYASTTGWLRRHLPRARPRPRSGCALASGPRVASAVAPWSGSCAQICDHLPGGGCAPYRIPTRRAAGGVGGAAAPRSAATLCTCYRATAAATRLCPPIPGRCWHGGILRKGPPPPPAVRAATSPAAAAAEGPLLHATSAFLCGWHAPAGWPHPSPRA